MRRLSLLLALLFVPAACADAPQTALPQQGAWASFPPGGVVNVIRVDARDTLPLRTVELVAPDGAAIPASSLDVDKTPERNGGQSTVNDPWRSSMFASTNGIPIVPSTQLDPTVRSQNTLLLMVSTADIPVPDPVAYRRDWQKYHIRLGFGAGGDAVDTREIPAPQPPPG